MDLLRMDWRDVGFLHWAVDPETVTEEQIGLLMGGEYPDDWDDSSHAPEAGAGVRTDGEGQ